MDASSLTIAQYVATEQRIPANAGPLRRALEYVATIMGTTLDALGAMPVEAIHPQVEQAYDWLASIAPAEPSAPPPESIDIGGTTYYLDLKPESMTVAQWLDVETICAENNAWARIIPLLAICLTTDPSAPYASSRLSQTDAVATMPAKQAIALADFFLKQWRACEKDTLTYMAAIAEVTAPLASSIPTTPPPTHS